jgi:hypothetical protein
VKGDEIAVFLCHILCTDQRTGIFSHTVDTEREDFIPCLLPCYELCDEIINRNPLG